MQPHWVGDLTLSRAAQGRRPTRAGPVRAGRRGRANRCEIDLADRARRRLFHGDKQLGRGRRRIKGAGTYDVDFANVDDRLTLWVDGTPVFGEGLSLRRPERRTSGPDRGGPRARRDRRRAGPRSR